MTIEKKRRKFTAEFKKESVALITEQGYSVAKAAQAVNVSENNIRRWRRELEQAAKDQALAPDEKAVR